MRFGGGSAEYGTTRELGAHESSGARTICANGANTVAESNASDGELQRAVSPAVTEACWCSGPCSCGETTAPSDA